MHGLSAPGLDLEIALEPDTLHRETQRRLSTGSNAHNQPLVLERGHTNLGQLDHLTLRSPDTTSQQAYQYDALGRMSFRSLQGDPAEKVIAYNYDAAGRLIGSQHGDNAHRYSVDSAGNRLEQGVDKQQGLTDNRLTQLNGARYRYGGAGNLIERQQPNGERLTLGYDGANRLVHLTHASELGYTREATYRYDGLGRRISKTVRDTNGTTATTHYGWDGDRIVREETDNQRTTVVYEPGSFVPMLRIDDTQQGQLVSAYITDTLGTPMQLVTPNGQPRWLAEPDDWAAVKNQRAVRNVTQPIRFQGQWHDEESGLYYNRHRYYDPQQGRYISQDQIGLKGGTNLYGYVTNPISMVDPLGLSGFGFNHLEPLSIPAGEAYGANMPAPTPETAGQHVTGGDYRPGIGALFPSSMSAFAKDPQYAEALRYQGGTRNATIPAAAIAAEGPKILAAAPFAIQTALGAGSAAAASVNQVSLHAMCSVATVSPGAAVGIANPVVQQRTLDFIDGFIVPGPPTNLMQGAGSAAQDARSALKEMLAE